jgi:hypothetical protein
MDEMETKKVVKDSNWKITSVRMSKEDYAALQAEKAATNTPTGTILLRAWKEKRGKGAGETDSPMVASSVESQPPSAQTTEG